MKKMKNYKITKNLNYNSMDLPPHEIRVALLRAGITQAEIARRCKVSISMVSKVIDGVSVSHKVRTAIAEAVGIDIRRIWPSTYIVYGGPRKAGRPKVVKETDKYPR